MNKLILDFPSTTPEYECKTIFGIAKKIPDKSILVEIGTGAGRITATIADSISGLDSIIHTTDNYSQFEKYEMYGEWRGESVRQRLADMNLNHNVILHRLSSEDLSKEISEVDFVYLDGAHDYDGVCSDIDIWYPKLKEGGIFAGHDFDPRCSDGRQVIKAIFDKLIHDYNKELMVVDRVWWMVK